MKKIFLCFCLLLFIIMPCFAILEGEVLWTTIQNEYSIRVVPLNDVKAQALRCLELYRYCYFDAAKPLDMMERQMFVYFLENRLEKNGSSFSTVVRRGYDYKLNWIRNNNSFVFLEYDHDLGSLITIVWDDVVFRLFFSDLQPSVLAKTSSDIVDRNKLTFLFDNMLEGRFGR